MHLLFLHSPALAQAARPGQFVLVQAGSGYDPYLRQPLAIHRLTEQGIALCLSRRQSDVGRAGGAPRGRYGGFDWALRARVHPTCQPLPRRPWWRAGRGSCPCSPSWIACPYAVQLVASVPTEPAFIRASSYLATSSTRRLWARTRPPSSSAPSSRPVAGASGSMRAAPHRSISRYARPWRWRAGPARRCGRGVGGARAGVRGGGLSRLPHRDSPRLPPRLHRRPRLRPG